MPFFASCLPGAAAGAFFSFKFQDKCWFIQYTERSVCYPIGTHGWFWGLCFLTEEADLSFNLVFQETPVSWLASLSPVSIHIPDALKSKQPPVSLILTLVLLYLVTVLPRTAEASGASVMTSFPRSKGSQQRPLLTFPPTWTSSTLTESSCH